MGKKKSILDAYGVGSKTDDPLLSQMSQAKNLMETIQPTNQPATKPTIMTTNRQTCQPATISSIIPSSVSTNRQSDRQTDRQSDRQTDSLSDRPSSRHSNQHSGQQPIADKYSDPVHVITNNQAVVLSFLIRNTAGKIQHREIVQHTGIAYGTVRETLRILTKYKFISKPKRFRIGQYQGVSYKINETLCDRFINERENDVQQSNRQSNRQSPYSSSSINTTTKDEENSLKPDPELSYWREKNLTQKQINNWMEELGLSQDEIVLYLNYCRFEMVDMDLEKSKPVGNAINWFYAILKKNGSYPRPKGYQSIREKRATELAQAVKQEAERIQALEEQYFDDTFKIWWSKLAKEERDKIDSSNQSTIKSDLIVEEHRKEYFRENVHIRIEASV